MINSNPVDGNGIQVVEGSAVYWTCQDRYQSSGDFIVSEVHEDYAVVVRKDGSKPDFTFAGYEELAVHA